MSHRHIAPQQRKHEAYVKRFGAASTTANPKPKKARPNPKPTDPKRRTKSKNPYAALADLPKTVIVKPRPARKPKAKLAERAAKPLPKLVMDSNVTITTYRQV
jgi:hypothetical protein